MWIKYIKEEYPMRYKYDFEKAVVLLNEAIDLNNKAKNIKDLQEAADYFLKSCYNVGINYEKR